MERDKATLPFGAGEAMLQRVVRLVGGEVPAARIVCVAAAGQVLPELPAEVRTVRDREPHVGPLAGVAAGLAALPQRAMDAAFVTGCDVPLLVPAIIPRLFDLLGDFQIAAPHDRERWHPLLAVYRTELLSAVETQLAGGNRSLIALIEHCRTRRVELSELRGVDPQFDSFVNINTRADYHSALRRAGYEIAN